MERFEHAGLPTAPLAERSVAKLIAAGGDSRLQVDPFSGLNRYGCASRPREDAMALGSCTASSVSPLGWAAAREALDDLHRQRWTAARRRALDEGFDSARRELVERLIGDDVPVDAVLTPSGTDAELIALALALGRDARPLTNVVIGPTEAGSGTALAAAGRHFDSLVPVGRRCEKGAPVDRALGARVAVEAVAVRDERGVPRPLEALDAEVEAVVTRAIRAGRKVLLHVLAHSKTGVHAPSLAAVGALEARFGEGMTVVVDAAQGRVGRRRLADAVSRGWLVIVTGSKFYGGPPFSGAVLVPRDHHPDRVGLDRLPRSFGDYFTAGQLPPTWARLREHLPRTANPGLLLRWKAALAEMRAYYDVPARERSAVLRAFERLVCEVLGESECIRLATVPPPIAPPVSMAHTDRRLESTATVFPFVMNRPGDNSRLDQDELARVYRWLDADVSWLLERGDARTREALAGCFHIGQPVAVGGRERSVLRVALGAPLLVKVATDRRCGATLAARTQWLGEQLRRLRDKLEAIAEHFDALEEAEDGMAAVRTGT